MANSKYNSEYKSTHVSKEKCNCVVETILGFIYWTVGCGEGLLIGVCCGCYDMDVKYDFSNIDAWFTSGLKTGYADGYVFVNG